MTWRPDGAIEGAASWTMAIFGAMAFMLGACGIVWPEGLLAAMGFEVIDAGARADSDYTRTFITASAVASFNMGAYYVLAARANWRAFYLWTVPFRGVTVCVFMTAVLIGRAPIGFIGVAAWELLGAVATGVALRWDQRRGFGPDPV